MKVVNCNLLSQPTEIQGWYLAQKLENYQHNTLSMNRFFFVYSEFSSGSESLSPFFL